MMTRLSEDPDLLLIGNPLLFQKSPVVDPDLICTTDFQHNLNILLAAQRRFTGIGMAAPQIGWSARVLSFGIEKSNPRYPWAKTRPLECWINPEIIWHSEETVWAWEGCLSVPGYRGWVERVEGITVRGYKRDGQVMEETLNDFPARIFLHEMDHLNGYLFPMRVQEPQWNVPLECFEQQNSWQKNWPTPGAYQTCPGEISLLQ